MDGIDGEIGRVSAGLRHHEPRELGNLELLHGLDRHGSGTARGGQ